MKKINIIVADDHDLIHNGLTDILQDEIHFEIIGHAYDGNEAIKMSGEMQPDIILMDISMPERNGIEASKIILGKYPDIKIIALSQHEEKEYVVQMLQIGCQGYLLKNSRKKEIVKALERVSSGNKYINPDMIDLLMTVNQEDEIEQNIPKLTSRELEILQNIAAGKSNPEIANFLTISVRTVETHRRNLMQKLKVNTVVDLLKYASRNKLIDL